MRFRRHVVALACLGALGAPLGVAASAPLSAPTPYCGASVGEPAKQAKPTKPQRLRVAQFNVLHGLTEEGDHTLEARLGSQLRQLAASRVDVVGMQEVSSGENHGRVINRMAEGLTKLTRETWYWCWFRNEPHFPLLPEQPGGGDPMSPHMARFANMHDSGWYAGQAVLSRWPIVAKAVRRLPGEDAVDRLTGDCRPPTFGDDPTCVPAIVFETRAALWTRIRTPYGTVSVTSAHTSGNDAQHRDLASWARAQSAKDALAYLVCDCNATPHSSAQDLIRAAGWLDTYAALHPRAGATSDQQIDAKDATVKERIDYVFARSRTAAAARLAGSRRFMNTPERVPASVTKSRWLWPSDHWGVITAVRPPGGARSR